jgi:hypothetical protein
MPIAKLYCPNCCLRCPVHQDGKQYRCAGCGSVLQPPKDPEACPRSNDGKPNPYRDHGRWIYSRCSATMPMQEYV